jgi:uncharacterized protein YccT (UPF0319 family)
MIQAIEIRNSCQSLLNTATTNTNNNSNNNIHIRVEKVIPGLDVDDSEVVIVSCYQCYSSSNTSNNNNIENHNQESDITTTNNNIDNDDIMNLLYHPYIIHDSISRAHCTVVVIGCVDTLCR